MSVFKDSLLGLILHKKTYNMWWTDADCAAFILVCVYIISHRLYKINICIISIYHCYGYGFFFFGVQENVRGI